MENVPLSAWPTNMEGAVLLLTLSTTELVFPLAPMARLEDLTDVNGEFISPFPLFSHFFLSSFRLPHFRDDC